MSATARPLEPEFDPQLDPQSPPAAAERTRPQLRLVSPLRPERASRGVFALIVTGLLGVGLIAMLIINTQLAQGAFVVSDLNQQLQQLQEQEAVLNEEVAAVAAPSALSSRARALGMIPSETPVFLRLPDGEVLGTPKASKVPQGAAAPSIAMPADATASEAVDNASVGTDIPMALPPDYDPAAADAGLDAVPVDAIPAAPKPEAKGEGKKAGKKAAKGEGKGANAPNSPWVEIPVETGDAGLDAVPIG